MAMLGYIVTAIIAAVTGIGTFYVMQHTQFSQELKIFIRVPPPDVFLYAKDPNNIPDINFRVRNVEIKNVNFADGEMEHWEYDVNGIMPHLGEHTTQIRAVADTKSRKLNIKMLSLFGLIQSQLVYTFTPAYDSDGMRGTRVTENSDFHIPWAILGFVNKTMRFTNEEMLKNLKYVLEGGLSKKLEEEEAEDEWELD